MNRAIVACTAAGLLAAASPVHADRPLEVGGFVGWHILSRHNAFGVDSDGGALRAPDGDFTFGLRVGSDLARRLAIEGELGLIPDESRADETDDIFLAAWRIQALLAFNRQEPGRPRVFFVVGGGGLSGASSDLGNVASDTDLALHTGLGAAVPVRGAAGLRLDYRLVWSPSVDDETTALDHVFMVGVYRVFGGAAPVRPAGPPKDSDGDGITDADDRCVDVAEDADGVADGDGCPEDDDGDGIADAVDKCRDRAEDKNGIDDADGCPDEDPDGDGVLGSTDGCPTDPEDKDGHEDADGCPDPDNDGDGVADGSDDCPTEKETRNGYRDDDGCADEIPAAVTKFTGAIKGITFVFGSAKIARSSNKTLDAAAAVLVEHPSIRLEIQGHTDDVGARELNMKLSQARADAVRDYLIGKGVDAARLRAVGYGPDKPVDPAKTKAARDKNRRVEFIIISQ